MAVSQDTISKIKSLPVSSILTAAGVELRRVGREFVTQCLWHNDKNPSLTISDDKGFVFCHVCQEHNDAIGYIQKKYGINFRDACQKIADQHGITLALTDENSEEYRQKKLEIDKLKEVTCNQQVQFRENLRDFPQAINFIQKRVITPEVYRDFQVGYDAENDRLTIPIHNHLGQLVGFTARALRDDAKPKYKNTENNLIFNKSDLVFNEARAADQIRENDECVFVEGHFDVISLWQNGVRNVVALQGTASPAGNVLKRLLAKTRQFVLCMDADAGGRSAVAKFLESVQSYTLNGELDVKIVTLPDGYDPDSYVKEGNDIKSLIINAPSWFDWILDNWLTGLDFNDKLKIQNVETQIKKLFSRISSPALRAHYYDKASIRLAQNRQSVAAEIAKGFHDHVIAPEAISGWKRPSPEKTRRMVERRFLRVYLHCPEYRFVLKPLWDKLCSPEAVWLSSRIQELEEVCSAELLLDSIKAVTCVAEPAYVQKIRSILSPSFNIENDELSIAHMEDILMLGLDTSGNLE